MRFKRVEGFEANEEATATIAKGHTVTRSRYGNGGHLYRFRCTCGWKSANPVWATTRNEEAELHLCDVLVGAR